MDHHADARLTMRVRTIKLQLPSKSTIYDIASCDEEEQTLVPTTIYVHRVLAEDADAEPEPYVNLNVRISISRVKKAKSVINEVFFPRVIAHNDNDKPDNGIIRI